MAENENIPDWRGRAMTANIEPGHDGSPGSHGRNWAPADTIAELPLSPYEVRITRQGSASADQQRRPHPRLTKFAKFVIVGGILALWPVVAFVRAFVEGSTGRPADPSTVIVITVLIYAAAGVVIVAPARVIQQVIIFLVKHAIIQAFTPKERRR
jgi:hypothetical protein